MSDLIIPKQNFVHLHNHSEHSLLDGISRATEMASRAKELGMPAIALTDHGRMSGLLSFYDACKKEGVKPILGMEAYMTPMGHHRSERINYDVKDMRGKPGHDRTNYHLILLAKDYQGYMNLCRLETASYSEGYYYKPRIDFELLCEHKEGLIVTSACILGLVSHYLYCDDYARARETALRFQEVFGDDYYLEIMNHELDMEKKIMPDIRRLGAELGIKVVATNDTHFVRKEDHKLQKTMMMMGMHKSWSDPDISGFYYDDDERAQEGLEAGDDKDSDPIFEMPPHLYLKDYDEMIEVLRYGGGDNGVAELELSTTLEIAEKCNCELSIIDPEDMSAYHTPIYPISTDSQYEDFKASNFSLRESTVKTIIDELHDDGREGEQLEDFLNSHEMESLHFLMWMSENGIESRIRPKLEAKGEPLPTEYWCENAPIGLSVEHAHNSPDELWIKKQFADGKTIDDILDIYRNRLDYEVSIVVRKGFLDYFSVVSSYTRWTKEQGSFVGAGRGCLSPDNMLYTDNGCKSIDKIATGDKVYDEKGILCEVDQTYEYDVDEQLIDLNIYNSDHVFLTPDHKVKVSKCQMHEKKHERDNNVFANVEPQQEAQWIPASQIEPGDWVYIPILKRAIAEDPAVFDLADYIPQHIENCCVIKDDVIEYTALLNQFSGNDILTQRKVAREASVSRSAINSFIHGSQRTSIKTIAKLNAYLEQFGMDAETWKEQYHSGITCILPRYITNSPELGYLFGHYIANGWIHRGAVHVVYNENDTLYMEKFTRCSEKVFGISPTFHKSFENQTLINGIIQNAIISSFFKTIVSEPFEQKRVPQVFMSASNTIVEALIEGILDSDGHADYDDSHTNYDTTSRDLAYQIKYLLNTFGVPSYIHEHSYSERPNYYMSYTVHISTNTLLEKIFQQPVQTNSPFSVNHDGYICCQVHSITPYDYKGKVYDLKVITDNEPSYLTTGCVVHNSGAGALLNYLLDITSIDPLPNGLMFERFLAPKRKGYPDIDIDFSKDFRDNHLKPYLRKIYGEDCAASVSTYMYLWGKAAIRSAARVLFNPPESLQIADEMCDALDDKPKLDLHTELDGSNIAFETIANSSKKHRQVLDLALEMQGRLSGESIHASAFILSPFPILDQMPLVVTKDERKRAQDTGSIIKEYCISYDGTETQDKLGFVKLDLLALKDLETMELVCKTVERIYGCKIDLEKLPLDDKSVFDLVRAGNNSGIFQFDGSPVALRILQESGADRIADWSAVNALNRPGPLQMGYDREFIDGKNDPKSVTYFAPAAESQLKETYGTICYQEQIMLLSQDPTIVGFDGTQADTLRKATAKKKADKVEAICNEAREVAKRNNTDPKVTEYFLEAAKASGSYSFNKSHSLAYAVVAYRGAFLKAHFPECFLAAMCTMKPMMKKVNKVPGYLEEARQLGIQVKPPHVNYSMEDFDVPEKGVIAFGLGGIKHVGKGAGPVIEERLKNGPYKDFTDFCCRVPKEVGKAPIEALIHAGACDGLGWSRMAMEESIDQIIQFRKDYFKEKEKRDCFSDDLFGGFGISNDDTSTQMPGITLVAPFETEYSERVLMSKEREQFGMYFDKDPRDFSQVSRFMLEKDLAAGKFPLSKTSYSQAQHSGPQSAAPLFVNVSDIPDLPNNTRVSFIANVEELKEFNTKTGKRMASMFVWDNGTGESSRFGFSPTKAKIKCTIFSSVLSTITKPLPDDVVYITGRVSVDEEGKWPTAVLLDTVELIPPDSQWLGSGASIEKMQEFAQAQAEMNAFHAEVGNPASKRYMIPAISFKTTDDLNDFCQDLRLNKLYLREGNVQISAEDDPDGDNTRIIHLKQTMGTVRLAAEYGGIAKKIRHPKAARALARKAMLEGRTVSEIEAEAQAEAEARAAQSDSK